MRALVVYESMYGNTHAIAIDIAAGLRATHEVTLVPVTRATQEPRTPGRRRTWLARERTGWRKPGRCLRTPAR